MTHERSTVESTFKDERKMESSLFPITDMITWIFWELSLASKENSLACMERQDCLMLICLIICSALFIRCGTPLIVCAIYGVISCAFVVICCGFATICGACVIICSDFSIISTFFHSKSTIFSKFSRSY